jgi:hypothetical protein
MAYKHSTIEMIWTGPYSWPGFEDKNHLSAVPSIPGVYLQTFKYRDGYLIYSAGITRRSVPDRFKEHTAKYMNGEYNILDISEAAQGIRKEIWHGWGYARKHRKEFELNKSIILGAVNKQLEKFCIFVAELREGARILERIEASIMNNLYKQPAPICDIPDKGMKLSSRWNSEPPIIATNSCESTIYGLPFRTLL